MGNEEILSAIGGRIAARRRQLRLTQEELAYRMDVSPQMISYAEQGRKAMRPENLIRLCDALDVSADYILTGRMAGTGPGRIGEKLSRLSPEQLELVETVIDCCLALADR